MSGNPYQCGRFSLYDTSNGDIDPLFATKLQEDAQVGFSKVYS